MKQGKSNLRIIAGGIPCLVAIVLIFGFLASKMGMANMLNTLMHTAFDLLMNTVFYLMSICVITGALGKIFMEFGVVDMLELVFRPLMKPIFNLPGVASLGCVLTFLSDNPAIITLAKDKKFSSHFRKYQYISLTNFGTSFGMGLLVIIYMISQGFFKEPLVGFLGAVCGCIVSTRLMQYFVLRKHPEYEKMMEEVPEEADACKKPEEKKSVFLRILDSLLDGGKAGVEIGFAIIPGVLIISTFVMMFTFGPSDGGAYTGAAYEGVEALPWLAHKVDFLFRWLFGFTDPHVVAFPITSLGAVGAALSLVPSFVSQGWMDGNAIAVCTAIGMCWSGFLSTHTAMLDALGCRDLTPKAILSHTVGGFVAGVAAHIFYLLFSLL